MRTIGSVKRILMSVAALLAASAVQAAPDLTIALSGTPTIQNSASGRSITFGVTYRNLGDALNGVSVRSKAFLVSATHDYDNQPGLKGIVLPPFDQALTLATNESVTRQITLVLPTVASDRYLLGAVTDTQFVLNESFQNAFNNTAPDMIDVGTVSNSVVETRDLINGIDLYHEVNSKLDLRNGRASHRSRMIARGNLDGVNWRTTIFARFLAIDVANKKLYMSAYNEGSVDKLWSAISWNPEADIQGRRITVDYYGNNPFTSNLRPGRYLLGVLLNSRDQLPEAFPENNLDLTSFTLNSPAVYQNPEIWMVADNVSPLPQQTLMLTSTADLSRGNHTFTAGTLPNWFTMTPSQGTFTSATSILSSVFAPAASLAPGEYSTTLQLSEADAGLSTAVPVKLFVFGNTRPQIALSSSSLNFTSQQGIDPAVSTVTITNNGSETLKFSLNKQEPWLFVSPQAGAVAPGQSVAVQVRAIQYGRQPGSFSDRITVYSNANNTPSTLQVNYSVSARQVQ